MYCVYIGRVESAWLIYWLLVIDWQALVSFNAFMVLMLCGENLQTVLKLFSKFCVMAYVIDVVIMGELHNDSELYLTKFAA